MPLEGAKARNEQSVLLAWRLSSAPRCHVDPEPLEGKGLGRAVLDGRLDRLVEALLQLGVLLAQADANAPSKNAAGEERADDRIILEVGFLQCSCDLRCTGENGIQPPGGEVQVV